MAVIHAAAEERVAYRVIDAGGAGLDLRTEGCLLDGSDESAKVTAAVARAKSYGVKRITLQGGRLGLPAGYQLDADMELHVLPGGTVYPLGANVTINGPIEAGLYQVFDLGAGGTMAFGSGVKDVRFRWFGAKPDAVTDHSSLLSKVTAMCAGGPRVMLEGGDPWDTSHGYLIDATVRVSTSGVAVVGEGGFARLIQGPNCGRLMLFGGLGTGPAMRGQYMIDKLWLKRTKAGGGGVGFEFATDIRIGELAGDGASGSLCDLMQYATAIRIGSIDGYDLGPTGACLFTSDGGGSDMVVGSLSATGGQEVVDITNAHNWQIGQVWGSGQAASTVEVSSCSNWQIGQIFSIDSDQKVATFKTEINGQPLKGGQVGRIFGRNFGATAGAGDFREVGVWIVNNYAAVDLANAYIDGLTIGEIDLHTALASTKGVVIVSKPDGRPVTKGLKIGKTRAHVTDMALQVEGTDGADLGDMTLRSDSPEAWPVDIKTSPGVRGHLTITNYTTGLASLNTINGCDLTLVSKVAQDRVDAALEGRPSQGVSCLSTHYGRLTVDLPDTRGYGISMGTSAGGDPGQEMPLVIRARIKCEGIGIDATSYQRLRIGGIDEEMATLISTGERALFLSNCEHRHVRARVRSDALPSALYGAATLAYGADHDDRIHVLSSAGKGLIARLNGSGQIEVTGGNTQTGGAEFYLYNTLPVGASIKLVGRLMNTDKSGAFTYAYRIIEQCNYAVKGLHIDLQCSDDQAVSTTRPLQVSTSNALATVITSSFVRLLMTRLVATAISGEALIDQPNCIYEKIVSLA